LTLAGGGAVFVALAIASSVIYVEVRSKLHDQIDVSLIRTAEGTAGKWVAANAFQQGNPQAGLSQGADGPVFSGDASGFSQVIPKVRTSAATRIAPGSTKLARTPRLVSQDDSVARGQSPPYFRNIRFAGAAMRLYTMRLTSAPDGLVRTARALTEANATITRVRWLPLGLTLGGALAAALLGRLAADAVLRPVRALAGAVREVSATRPQPADPGRRPGRARKPRSRLQRDADSLDESQQAQQQLIADASHELRTPLTAHRANIELLARPDLPAERRQRVLGAAVRSIEELSTLVGDLIQAARDGRSVDAREPLALDELVAAAVERAQHRAPVLRFESRLEPYRVVGACSRLERAVDNVLDNAIKWSPPGGTVDVRLADGGLTVRDHGPGIAEADLPYVFDRFYRAAAARALPGSVLGLVIVKQTVDDH
jgi:two-component system sensor histidine kinase MprB